MALRKWWIAVGVVWGRAGTVGTEPRRIAVIGGAGLVVRVVVMIALLTWGARGCRRLVGGIGRWWWLAAAVVVVMGLLGLLVLKGQELWRHLLHQLLHPMLLRLGVLTLVLATKVLSLFLSVSDCYKVVWWWNVGKAVSPFTLFMSFLFPFRVVVFSH